MVFRNLKLYVTEEITYQSHVLWTQSKVLWKC